MPINKLKTYTPVVVGLICQNGKILLGLRPNEVLEKTHQSIADYWEFPGGKIKWTETPEDALKRELEEELGISAQIDGLKIAHNYAYNLNHAVLLLFYKVISWQGEIKNLYHTDLKWVEPSQLKDYRLLPANKSILPQLIHIILEQPLLKI